ncbi:MAG: MBL fold metallo-hydrolase [Flavobacteriales bacterium]|nr:MBL fold metallo-hydrolase [Flavobacteriales bacterium]
MKVTFLGTGTSQGIPVIACDCEVCTSADPKDNRLRTSVMIEAQEKVIVIDTGPDFRQQMLRHQVKHLDAVLFTHEHKDHVAGLDDVRAFNFRQKSKIDIYGTVEVHNALKREFHYAFSDFKYPGVPELNLVEIENKPFSIQGIEIDPVRVMHYKMPVFGFRIGNFSYITDAKTISAGEMNKLKGTEILVLNALRREDHISHFTLAEALEVIQKINPVRAYLTHLSHLMGKHEVVREELPPNVDLAYDGLVLEI